MNHFAGQNQPVRETLNVPERDTLTNVETQTLKQLGELHGQLSEIALRVIGTSGAKPQDGGAPHPIPSSALGLAVEIRNDVMALNELALSILNDL